MSMNLHCEEMELWQTPTYITFMCYSNNDGGWEGIKYRYIEWVKDKRNGGFRDEEQAKEIRRHVQEHIDKLNSFESLDFYIM